MEKKHSHLTLDERIVIEQGIKRKMSFSAIAASIGKDRSTVSREVQRNRKRYPGSASRGGGAPLQAYRRGLPRIPHLPRMFQKDMLQVRKAKR